MPIFCVITAKYTVNCQIFALNLKKFTPARKIYTDGVGRVGDNYLVWSQVWLGGHLAILKPRFSSLPSQTVASDLGSLSQHCKILLDLETFCPTSSFWWQTIQWLFANTKKKISKFQSFEVSKFHGQSINQLIFSGCASISKYWIGVRSRMIMKPICKRSTDCVVCKYFA